MSTTRLAPAILALMLAGSSQAASLTPPNLTAATTLNNADLLLVWPNASNGPLEAMQWSIFEGQIVAGVGSAFLQPSNNFSDVGNPTIARSNLGLGTAALVDTGTSGNVLCALGTSCTWSSTQTFSVAPVFSNQSGTRTALGLGDLSTQNAATPPALGATTPNTAKFSLITDTGITGSTQCVQANSSGVLSGTGASCNTSTTGNFLPTFAYTTPGTSSISYSQQAGRYSCVAGWVTADLTETFTPTNGTASGTAIIGGLPYTPDTTIQVGGGPVTGTNGAITWGGAGTQLVLRVTAAGSGSLAVVWLASGSGGGTLGPGNFASGSSAVLAGVVTYKVSGGSC
jgi:hypothetical protein